MKNKKLISAAPFFVWGIVMIYTWVTILVTGYFPTSRHVAAVLLFLLNGVLYFTRFKTAVLVTGTLLLVGVFDLLAFFPEDISSSFSIRIGTVEISTPGVQWKSLLLLLVYFGLNTPFLFSLYLEYKESRK